MKPIIERLFGSNVEDLKQGIFLLLLIIILLSMTTSYFFLFPAKELIIEKLNPCHCSCNIPPVKVIYPQEDIEIQCNDGSKMYDPNLPECDLQW